jgi:hypothetical protein
MAEEKTLDQVLQEANSFVSIPPINTLEGETGVESVSVRLDTESVDQEINQFNLAEEIIRVGQQAVVSNANMVENTAAQMAESDSSWRLPPQPSGSGWIEPPSAANPDNPPIYPFNSVTQSESGHFWEFDDTPGRERVRMQHRTGTFFEWHPNGDEVHKIQGDSFTIVAKNNNVKISGRCNITIDGDATTEIKGNKYEIVRGDCYQIVEGNYDILVKKNFRVDTDGKMDISVGSDIMGGTMSVAIGGGIGNGQFKIKADTFVEGALSSTENITADKRVDAGLGMSAGIYGFVTELGGFSAGIPVATPLSFTCTGLVSGSFGQFFHVTDVVNILKYNFHSHPSASGPPTIPML